MEKSFKTEFNIGSVKYAISYHNGMDTYSDGSPFFGICTFRNKRLFEKKIRCLLKEGYKQD